MRRVLGFSFACGRRPHAKLNRRAQWVVRRRPWTGILQCGCDIRICCVLYAPHRYGLCASEAMFSFACGGRHHPKLNRRTTLAAEMSSGVWMCY